MKAKIIALALALPSAALAQAYGPTYDYSDPDGSQSYDSYHSNPYYHPAPPSTPEPDWVLGGHYDRNNHQWHSQPYGEGE
jgi:hypothetical protein